jgi:long-chain acyl-CoA synthetase
MGLNLYDVFHQTARRQADRPALLGPGSGEVLSYALADEAITAAAARLAVAGIGPGACVGLHCPSGARYVLATYAAWQRGASVVPIPVELTRPEKEQILRTVAIDFVITPPASSAFFAPHRPGEGVELWSGDGGLSVFPVSRLREPPPGFAAVNAAFVRFTSGTTAAAKGVVLSHETIFDRIGAANEVLQLGPRDRVVWLLSMAYHFAVSIVAYLSFGAGIVLPANHFAGAVLAAARRHGGTMIYGSPTHFAWLASAPDAAPLPDLRLAISTTASLDRATAEHFRARFGVPLGQALGIIEIGLPFINRAVSADRPEAVGAVLPAYDLRLEDVGLGNGCGEIWLRGPGFLDAYYEPWKPRRDVLANGWFRTGDVAERGGDGTVVLRGRLKDVISVLGMKFFPQEVEAVLASHPTVQAACVVGQPDARLGEVSHARVQLRPGLPPPSEGELLAHCERQLALYKVPRRIEFVAELQRTASGKILHRSLAVSSGQ